MPFQRSESFGKRYSARIGAVARAQATATELLYTFLATSSGETNLATSTGGTGNQIFRYICPANREAFIERVNILAYGRPVNPDTFIGSTIETALSNGLKIQVLTSTSSTTALLDFLNGRSITRNSDWGWLAGVDTPILNSTAPTGDDGSQTIRWTIGKSGFGLKLTASQNLAFITYDNLSAMGQLTEIRAQVQGAIFSST